jgi:hypothetical protein
LDPLSVSYEFSRDDYLAAMCTWIDQGPAIHEVARAQRRRAVRSLRFSVPVMFLVCFWIPWRTPMDLELRIFGGVFIGATISGLYAMHIASLPNYVKKLRQQSHARVEQTDVGSLTGRQSIEIAPEHFIFRSPAAEFRLPWRSVRAITPLSGWSFIQLHDSLPVIPDRAFDSAASRDAFIAVFRERIEQARLPEPERIKRFLQDRDRPCPKCKYNLRNAATDRCPECGHHLRYSELVS